MSFHPLGRACTCSNSHFVGRRRRFTFPVTLTMRRIFHCQGLIAKPDRRIYPSWNSAQITHDAGTGISIRSNIMIAYLAEPSASG